MTKSMREAKVHTTWATPNAEYEDAVLSFVDGVLDADEGGAFFASFLPFIERVARFGVENSLVQTTLKLTCPGIPDIYQGAELWDLSLVDPDNRRPIDYQRRTTHLDRIEREQPRLPDLLRNWRDGAVKILLTTKLLALRAKFSEAFEGQNYEPLPAIGIKNDFVCAFARGPIVIAAALFPSRRAAEPDWGDTQIPLPAQFCREFRNVLTDSDLTAVDQCISPDTAFADLPVCVLAPA
jgi:(1->4)-alpha-D-glucan 1-alpha-D-glucosylmutase